MFAGAAPNHAGGWQRQPCKAARRAAVDILPHQVGEWELHVRAPMGYGKQGVTPPGRPIYKG